jgi:hypothetical protein
MNRLNSPDEPIRRNEKEEAVAAAFEAKGGTKAGSGDADKNAGVSESGDQGKDDPVAAQGTQDV